MKLMLDTHFLVWLSTERHKLRRSELTLIEDRADDLLVSPLSIWELRLKWRSAAAKAISQHPVTPDAALRFVFNSPIALVPLTGEDIAATLVPPLDHGDPFDEMLLVHTQRLGARLLTRDRALLAHPLALSA